ncbi:lysin A [Gordonia phage BiggityBass]|nr:lysin A [Gordonia phage BiggityBass]
MADPTWIPEALRAEGLTCHIFDGAFGRGQGDMPDGYLIPFIHHMGASGTAGPGSIARHPTLGLASQLYLGRNGEYTLCGVGVAYHAGVGSWPGLPTNNANFHSIGIEAENSGTEGWSAPQYTSYLRGVRALNRHQRRALNSVVAHKEYGAVQGKWDPGLIDMKRFRSQLVEPGKAPENMIEREAREHPWIGARKAKPGAEGETPVGRDRRGRMVAYERAHIYFHPRTGAFVVPHADPALPGTGIFEAWAALGWESGALGYPVRDWAPIEAHGIKGAVQAFQGGVLYVPDDQTALKPSVVTGLIGQRWAAEGYETGELGWPKASEVPNGTGGRLQEFQYGWLEWDPTSAVKHLGEHGMALVRDLSVVDQTNGLPLALGAVELVAA